MTNGDKYLKDGITTDKFWNAYIDYIDKEKLGWNAESFELFLSSPIKPTLTEDEKVILRNIDEEYGYIERANDGTLKVNNKSTSDDQFIWKITYPHNHLFQFIQPRRRI